MDVEKIIKEWFELDDRIVVIRHYADGWVPNSYRYACPGTGKVYYRYGGVESLPYDRKRSQGDGPVLVAFSEKGGRLAVQY